MHLGIRTRLSVWMLAILVPVALAGWYAISRVEDRVEDRIVANLENVRRLEAARVDQALDDYRSDASSLAAGPHLLDFTAAVTEARAGDPGDDHPPIGGVDGFAPIDPWDPEPLGELAEALRNKARTTGSEVVAVSIVGVDGSVLGSSRGTYRSPDPALAAAVASRLEPRFGSAYRTDDGEDLLLVVAPIIVEDRAVGVLQLETRLGPIVGLVMHHEGFGDSSEAHIAQPTADGDAAFITPLRFAPGAAFDKVVPQAADLPINQSLSAPDGAVVWSPDYRGVDSVLAIETIEATGWGLVVKIDAEEALAPVSELRRTMVGAGAAGLVIIVLGWLVLVDPMSRRLRRTASAATRVAGGDYDFAIDDRSNDEIGRMANSIDQLAAELATDIAKRAAVEARLRRRATHDELTGLINRQHASEMIDGFVAADGGKGLTILFLDLDGFKLINDTYGHAIGDEVLVACADRLAATVADEGTVARWGGDEFVVVLPPSGEPATALVDAVHRAFHAPVSTSAGTHHVRFSVGSASVNGAATVDEVLLHADAEMFSQKKRRSDRRSVSPDVVRTIEAAFRDDRIDVWYQPIVDLTTDAVRIVGCEALVRIRDEQDGMLAPGRLIAEIQASQLGAAIDREVIATAFAHTASLIDRGAVDDDFRVSVNCGESLLRDAATADFLADQLELSGLQAGNVILELSEQSTVVQQPMIARVRQMGMDIAIDDVGLQQSNLDRLVDAQATIAKLDRRWLPHGDDDRPEQTEIVLEHLVSMCQRLGMTVIAECVEGANQLDRLRASGVDVFQGHLFARAIPAEAFERLCRQGLAAAETTAGG